MFIEKRKSQVLGDSEKISQKKRNFSWALRERFGNETRRKNNHLATENTKVGAPAEEWIGWFRG